MIPSKSTHENTFITSYDTTKGNYILTLWEASEVIEPLFLFSKTIFIYMHVYFTFFQWLISVFQILIF